MGLKEMRKNRGLTLKALSEKSGMHAVQIAQYESGRRKIENMSLKNAKKLIEALDCTLNDLL